MSPERWFAVVNLSYASPETFSLRLSIYLVVGTVAAGLGTLWGIVFGALLIEWPVVPTFEAGDRLADGHRRVADKVLPLTLDPSAIGIADFVFGAVLVGVMRLLPTGAGGLLRRGVTSLTDRLYTADGLDAKVRSHCASRAGARRGRLGSGRLDGRPRSRATRSSSAAPPRSPGKRPFAAAVARGAEAYFNQNAKRAA